MLIGVIEVLKNPERVLCGGVGGSLVGLRVFDDEGDICGDAIYHSARTCSVRFRTFEDRELMPATGLQYFSPSINRHKLIDEMIQSGPQLIQSLPCKQDKLDARIRDCHVPDGKQASASDDFTGRIGLFLDSHGVGSRIGKEAQFFLKIEDVGFGPV